MIVVTRVLIGALGLLLFINGLNFLLNTGDAAQGSGLDIITLSGWATLRADVAGFFLIGGGISIFAAVKGNAGYLWPVLLLVAAAFFGRAVTIIVNGWDSATFVPMGIEVIIMGLIAYAQRVWSGKGE